MGANNAKKQIDEVIRKGDLLDAIERAREALASDADNKSLQYLLVLATARSGAIDWAERLYYQYELDQLDDVDNRSLGARLKKDRAFRATGNDRQKLIFEAAEAYGVIYQSTGNPFPGINAATLLAIYGDTKGAELIARELLGVEVVDAAKSYWDAATKAEALFVLGQDSEAIAVLKTAIEQSSTDLGSISSTYRNLKALLDGTDSSGERTRTLKAALNLPNVAVYSGHIFSEVPDKRYRSDAELRAAITKALDENNIHVVYGALAAGSDILLAEAVLELGRELHVVIPFDESDFIEQSVDPSGRDWKERFAACKEKATTCVFATRDRFVGDVQQFEFGSLYAEGMARLKARHIDSEPMMFAIWDGKPGSGSAGTGPQVTRWQEEGGSVVHVPLNRKSSNHKTGATGPETHPRKLKTMLFTDFPGFTKLPESVLPVFWDEVMGGISEVLKGYNDEISAQNTWGDAVHVVISDPLIAADIALKIQESVSLVDYRKLDLDEPASMRIGMHFGPVYETFDQIIQRPNFFGTQVSEAARVEPVTPPGAVYVTEPFAALMERQDYLDKFETLFVGNIYLAKNYGKRRMYSLMASTHATRINGTSDDQKSSMLGGLRRIWRGH